MDTYILSEGELWLKSWIIRRGFLRLGALSSAILSKRTRFILSSPVFCVLDSGCRLRRYPRRNSMSPSLVSGAVAEPHQIAAASGAEVAVAFPSDDEVGSPLGGVFPAVLCRRHCELGCALQSCQCFA